jgi:hypothetical protein
MDAGAAWVQRRQVLQGIVPQSYWTALERYEDASWSAHTPGMHFGGARMLTRAGLLWTAMPCNTPQRLRISHGTSRQCNAAPVLRCQ